MKIFSAAVLALAASLSPAALASDWVVSVREGSAKATELADAHGLTNEGEVLPDSGLFHLRSRSRAKRDLSSVSGALSAHPSVDWLDHQTEPLVRSKRAPTGTEQNKVCFINTLASEERGPKRCVFPFAYKGKSYLRCTADHSSNGKEWCATEVRPDGEVVQGQWGDCDLVSG